MRELWEAFKNRDPIVFLGLFCFLFLGVSVVIAEVKPPVKPTITIEQQLEWVQAKKDLAEIKVQSQINIDTAQNKVIQIEQNLANICPLKLNTKGLPVCQEPPAQGK